MKVGGSCIGQSVSRAPVRRPHPGLTLASLPVLLLRCRMSFPDGPLAGAPLNFPAPGGGAALPARITKLAAETITGTDTTLTATLTAIPETNSLKLFLNGVEQEQGVGADFLLAGISITWLANTGTAVNMDPIDRLVAYYRG